MSRLQGGARLFLSQSPDDFSGEDNECLNEKVLTVAFATNAKPMSTSRILGAGGGRTVSLATCKSKRYRE